MSKQLEDPLSSYLEKMRRQVIAFCENKEELYRLQDMLDLLEEYKTLITQHLTEKEAAARERKIKALACLLYFVTEREMEERIFYTKEEEEEDFLDYILEDVDITPAGRDSGGEKYADQAI